MESYPSASTNADYASKAKDDIAEENETLGMVFDQSVDEQTQLEDELERNPDNAKLKVRLQQVRQMLDQIMDEIDSTDQRVGHRTLQLSALKGMKDASKQMEAPAPVEYVDTEGFIHRTSEAARSASTHRDNYVAAGQDQ